MPLKSKDDGETPRDYYYRVLKAKQNNEEWAKKIKCDSHVYFADTGQEEKLIKLTEMQRNKCYGGVIKTGGCNE